MLLFFIKFVVKLIIDWLVTEGLPDVIAFLVELLRSLFG